MLCPPSVDVIAEAKSLNLLSHDYAATTEQLKEVEKAKVSQKLSLKGQVLALKLLDHASQSDSRQPLVIAASKWPKPKASIASLPRSLHDLILAVPSSGENGEALVRSVLPTEVLKMKGWTWNVVSLATLPPKAEMQSVQRLPHMPAVRAWLQGALGQLTI